jgi:hypothetical protein
MRVPEHVVFRKFETETVVLNLQSGNYHGLNPTAGRMLELLGELGSFGATAAAIGAEFDAPNEQVEADLLVLCHDLIERGLLEVVPSPDE